MRPRHCIRTPPHGDHSCALSGRRVSCLGRGAPRAESRRGGVPSLPRQKSQSAAESSRRIAEYNRRRSPHRVCGPDRAASRGAELLRVARDELCRRIPPMLVRSPSPVFPHAGPGSRAHPQLRFLVFPQATSSSGDGGPRPVRIPGWFLGDPMTSAETRCPIRGIEVFELSSPIFRRFFRDVMRHA